VTDTSDEAINAMKKFLTGTGVIYAQGNLWAWDISSMLSALRDERNALRTKLAWWNEQSREMLEAVEKAEDERDRLRKALRDLLDLCSHADFKNGVTDATGTMDEGEHWAAVSIDRARAALGEDRT
jgi:hypothetical protein